MPNIVIPPGMNPTPPPEKFDEQDGKSMREKWLEHIDKRYALSDKGVGSSELDKMGLRKYTYDEFVKAYKKGHPPTEKEIMEKKEY